MDQPFTLTQDWIDQNLRTTQQIAEAEALTARAVRLRCEAGRYRAGRIPTGRFDIWLIQVDPDTGTPLTPDAGSED